MYHVIWPNRYEIHTMSIAFGYVFMLSMCIYILYGCIVTPCNGALQFITLINGYDRILAYAINRSHRLSNKRKNTHTHFQKSKTRLSYLMKCTVRKVIVLFKQPLIVFLIDILIDVGDQTEFISWKCWHIYRHIHHFFLFFSSFFLPE